MCALVNQRGEVIASKVRGAFDSASRKQGLLGRDGLDEGEAIIIAPCNAVHTFFMRFAIDVVYVDREGHVVRVKENLRPWRVDGCWRGFAVVEMEPPRTRTREVRLGDKLSAVSCAHLSLMDGDRPLR